MCKRWVRKRGRAGPVSRGLNTVLRSRAGTLGVHQETLSRGGPVNA